MEKTEDREMRATRRFKVSGELMWKAWTDPECIANWWAPKGFTTTIHQMGFEEGGEWNLTIHGPDGTNYPNRSVFLEIIALKKIVFEHFNPHFISTVLFDSDGKETWIDWTMLFDTAEMRDIIVNVHKADKGQQENLEKLEQYLAGLKESSRFEY